MSNQVTPMNPPTNGEHEKYALRRGCTPQVHIQTNPEETQRQFQNRFYTIIQNKLDNNLSDETLYTNLMSEVFQKFTETYPMNWCTDILFYLCIKAGRMAMTPSISSPYLDELFDIPLAIKRIAEALLDDLDSRVVRSEDVYYARGMLLASCYSYYMHVAKADVVELHEKLVIRLKNTMLRYVQQIREEKKEDEEDEAIMDW